MMGAGRTDPRLPPADGLAGVGVDHPNCLLDLIVEYPEIPRRGQGRSCLVRAGVS
jgi:hypothetical protein